MFREVFQEEERCIYTFPGITDKIFPVPRPRSRSSLDELKFPISRVCHWRRDVYCREVVCGSKAAFLVIGTRRRRPRARKVKLRGVREIRSV